MVVLDEPNASLDAEGDEALTRAIQVVKARGGICVVITHRPSGLAAVDLVGAMAAGRMQAFGPREDILQQMMRRGGMAAARRPQGPGSVNSHAGESGAASMPQIRQVGGES
jgi:ABC-type protease/lipase transport system fused ATPase/permease subunit